MIRIITDSMSDYTHFPTRAGDVTVVPQPVRFGLEEFPDDGVAMTPADFYARMRTAPELPKTSMVAMEDWKRAFNQALSNPDDQVLCLAGSSRLSGGYQSALLARKSCRDPERVAVLDTLSASIGEILLIIAARTVVAEGVTLAQAMAEVSLAAGKLRLFGLADDLKYLVMGGRLNPLIGKVGGALNIKPALKLEGGVIEKAGVVRGVKKGYAWYADMLRQYRPDRRYPVLVGGADASEAVEAIRRQLMEAGLAEDIQIAQVGCVIGAHVGPGTTLVGWVEE